MVFTLPYLDKFLFDPQTLASIVSEDLIPSDYWILLKSSLASLNSCEYVDCLKCCDILLKIVWEKLNTDLTRGPLFRDQHLIKFTKLTIQNTYCIMILKWRLLYSAASLHRTLALAYKAQNETELIDALKACDMGLIMGAPIKDNCLAELASLLHQSIRKHQCSSSIQSASGDDLIKVKRAKIEPTALRVPQLQNDCEIERLSLPSLMSFQTDYLLPRKPLVLANVIDGWPAYNKWSVDYIREIAGCRTVPVEIGSKYTEQEWSQKLMSIEDFIDQFFSDEVKKPGYLAQHQLFDQITTLKEDIIIPDYCFLTGDGDEDSVDINAWFGPKGTVSPLHQDPRDNFLVQVFGSKYIRLYDVKESENVYPYEDGMMTNTSQVDIESPDYEKFPRLRDGKFQECILGPGEVLYIPKQWWHFVKSLEPSFSVSFWFGD